jgi:hypothetical protein
MKWQITASTGVCANMPFLEKPRPFVQLAQRSGFRIR